MLKTLTNPVTLWVLFALFVIETISFGLVMAIWDFGIIDEMSDPEKIQRHIDNMSQSQRMTHAWMTGTLDVAYPLTYGALFAGLSLRAFRPSFAIPAFAVIPTDLSEGVVQILLLTGNDQLLWLKAYITPLKFALIIIALLIAIPAIAMEIRNARRRA